MLRGGKKTTSYILPCIATFKLETFFDFVLFSPDFSKIYVVDYYNGKIKIKKASLS